MSKNWSLALVVAFVLGYSVKSYLDHQAQSTSQVSTELLDATTSVFEGKDAQQVVVFDNEDPRVRVLYFGFTRCPDVCPTSLAMLAGALNQIDEETKSQLRPILISLDPERDLGAFTHKYAQYFHPMIEGVSGTMEQTLTLADKYGVIFRKAELEQSELEYTIDHSSYFYFTKPNGELITKVPHTLNPAPIVQAINDVIKTKQP